MINVKQLSNFFLNADKVGYASGSKAKKIKEKDGSKTIVFKKGERRGPKKYMRGDFVYSNKFKGGINNFHGEETIKFEGKKIYTARYAGGLIDQRKEKNG